jgi:hypothetical protein
MGSLDAQVYEVNQTLNVMNDTVEEIKKLPILEPKIEPTIGRVAITDNKLTTIYDDDKVFDKTILITCHGCKTSDEVIINNTNISLLETTRNGTVASTSIISENFGPPNVPSIVKKIGNGAKLKTVIDVIKTHTGNTFSTDEPFFSVNSEFVLSTPTSYAVNQSNNFKIHDAKLFLTGCRLRHSGIFALDQDDEVEDIGWKLDLTQPEVMRSRDPVPECSGNAAHIHLYDPMIERYEQYNSFILDKIKELAKQNLNDKNRLITRLKNLYRRNVKDISHLRYHMNGNGYIETGSHAKKIMRLSNNDVLLSDILNHSYFKKDGNTSYLVILHVCRVPCNRKPGDKLQRTPSFTHDSLARQVFSRAIGPYGGGNLDRRKSGSKKKRARAARAARAVTTRTKRNRTKKRGTRNKNNNNNTNKRRKNK